MLTNSGSQAVLVVEMLWMQLLVVELSSSTRGSKDSFRVDVRFLSQGAMHVQPVASQEYHLCNDYNLEKCMVASTSWQPHVDIFTY